MKNKQKSVVRPAHIIFLVVAVIITLFLAWWQWTRFRSGSGTLQNLGYALQWPIFGGALVWAYRRYVSLENELAHSEESASNVATASGCASQGGVSQGNQVGSAQGSTQNLSQGSQVPPELMVPQRPTIDVEEFNRLNTPRRGHNEGHNEGDR